MIASRRVLPSRYEFRFGTSECLALAAGVVLVCALTFVVGMLVGRATAPAAAPGAHAAHAVPDQAEATPAPVPARGSSRTPAGADEHLTFYKTLTSPSTDLPSVGQPTVEEHLVPRGEPVVSPPPPVVSPPPKVSAPSAVKAGVPPPHVARERHPAPAATARPEPPPVRSRLTSAGAAASSAAASPLWTVQVSSFRSRALADDLRAHLAARGFDAYLVSMATDEGRVRYRVRVGAFTARGEAERVAAELRAERTLSPFVTPRSR